MTYEQVNTANVFSLSIFVGIFITITRWYSDCWIYKQKNILKEREDDDDEPWGQFIIIDE